MLIELPAIPLEKIMGKLPEVPALYFVQENGRVIYVGRTKNLKARWIGHHRMSELSEREGITLAWLPVSDAADLPELENYFIDTLHPEVNGSPLTVNGGISGALYGMMRELWNYTEERDQAIEATHPGFTCRCDKCGSFRVYVDSDAGRSDESGAWGGVFLQCADCQARTDVWENF